MFFIVFLSILVLSDHAEHQEETLLDILHRMKSTFLIEKRKFFPIKICEKKFMLANPCDYPHLFNKKDTL